MGATSEPEPSGEGCANALAPLAVVAGAGALPARVAEAAATAGRRVLVVALARQSDPRLAAFERVDLGLGELGRFFAELERRAIEEVVLAGPVPRPDLTRLRFDFGALKSLPEIYALARGGDDRLLGGVIALIERRGLRVRGAHEIAPDLTLSPGAMTRAAPDATQRADIALGLAVLAATGSFDIGQALVVAGERVLALEAAEGTDAMLARVADLRAQGRVKLSGRAGVLVKAAKPGQDLRVDMPAVGVRTVEEAGRAGLCGLALEAGRVLVPEGEAVRAAAEAAGLFLVGTGSAGSAGSGGTVGR